MAISSLNQGMTWSEVFGILNQLIALVNSQQTAIGDTLVNGRIDYTRLINIPKINGVELIGDRAQNELNLQADEEVLQAVRDFGTRIDDFSTGMSGHLTRIVALEDYRTGDNNRITALESEKTTRDTQVSGLVAEAALIVAASNQAYAAKTDALAAKDLAVSAKNDAVSAKNAAVNAKTAAETAAASVPTNAATRINNLEDRLGDAGRKVSVSADLKESRVKTNALLDALKALGAGDVYDRVKEIINLDVNY